MHTHWKKQQQQKKLLAQSDNAEKNLSGRQCRPGISSQNGHRKLIIITTKLDHLFNSNWCDITFFILCFLQLGFSGAWRSHCDQTREDQKSYCKQSTGQTGQWWRKRREPNRQDSLPPSLYERSVYILDLTKHYMCVHTTGPHSRCWDN